MRGECGCEDADRPKSNQRVVSLVTAIPSIEIESEGRPLEGTRLSANIFPNFRSAYNHLSIDRTVERQLYDISASLTVLSVLYRSIEYLYLIRSAPLVEIESRRAK